MMAFTSTTLSWNEDKLEFKLNDITIAKVKAKIRTSGYWEGNEDNNSFSIFLNEGDKIYFSVVTDNATSVREIKAYCYPMF